MRMINRNELNWAGYYISRLLKAARNPSELVKYIFDSIIGAAKIRLEGNHVSPSDEMILEEEWDVLVILDACRYDSLKQLNPFESECQPHLSQASNTGPWFMKNFATASKDLTDDVIYVTANPRASSLKTDRKQFFHIENVFEEYYSKDLGTVPPEPVTDRALDLHWRHPDKRLVIHYVQPHGPLIGTDYPDLHVDQFRELRNGNISREFAMSTYHECLDFVLEEVDRLVSGLNGNVVISADHGEAFGKSGVYGHPPWAHIEELLRVPWIEIAGGGERPTIQRRERSANVSADVEDQLESLGYS